MKKETIVGYGNQSVIETTGFNEVSGYNQNHLPLFFGLLNHEIKIGHKILSIAPKDGDEIPVELYIVKMHLGFGNQLDEMPKGFAPIILVEGSEKNISLLKSQLKEIGSSTESTEEYIVHID